MTAAAQTIAAPATGAPAVAWHALTPDEALRQQGVDVEHGLTTAEADARRAKDGPNTFAEAKKASRWQPFSRQYADPMQIVLLVAGVVCLFLPGQFYTGVFLHPADPVQRLDGHEPGRQGGGERLRPPEG